MTTLAGSKIRRFREAQEPRLTRARFGARFDVPAPTVNGWEEQGKIPRDAAVLRRLAIAGICQIGDWYRPATCPRCGMDGDDARIADCRAAGCPIAEAKVA